MGRLTGHYIMIMESSAHALADQASSVSMKPLSVFEPRHSGRTTCLGPVNTVTDLFVVFDDLRLFEQKPGRK